MFFGIAFTDGTIQIRVLESVQEYIEEGQALHHCVFTNEYHLKEKSLILSASIAGKRIETIEVSLETMEVLQCRGLMNQNCLGMSRCASTEKNPQTAQARSKQSFFIGLTT